MGTPFKSPPFKSPPFSVHEPLSLHSKLGVEIRYIWMYVHVKRNGKIIHYDTSYTPFGVERPIQPEVT